jgi:hypothetical protein
MKRWSETFLWEAREPRPDMQRPQQVLGAWVRAGAGRCQSDDVKRGSETYLWEAREPKPDMQRPQQVLGAWVHAGAGR